MYLGVIQVFTCRPHRTAPKKECRLEVSSDLSVLVERDERHHEFVLLAVIKVKKWMCQAARVHNFELNLLTAWSAELLLLYHYTSYFTICLARKEYFILTMIETFSSEWQTCIFFLLS